MSNNDAISQELARVRKLKRALEAEVEMLRTAMESDKIHVRVSRNQEFRQELAEAMVKVSEAGYDEEYQGWYVADPVNGKIYHCELNSHPPDEAEYHHLLNIKELFDENCDYQIDIDWYERICSYLDLDALTEEYLAEHPDEDEEVYKDDLVEWIRNEPQYRKLIAEIKDEAYEEVVSFALENIKDEVIIEI